MKINHRHYAANRGNLLSFKLLLAKGADPNILAQGEVPVFFLTTNNDSVDFVEHFHESGIFDFQKTYPPDGSSLLHCSAATGAYRITKYILENNLTPVDFVNELGFTPLHIAAEFGQKHLIELFSKHGANMNAKTEDGVTPIHRAVEQNRAETLERLIHFKADPFLKNGLGISPLFLAVTNHHLPVLQVLVEKGGVWVNEKDDLGNPPTVAAVEGGYPKITKYLLTRGCDVNGFRRQDGATLLNIAIQERHSILSTLLLQDGADPNIPNDLGFTPLHTAASLGLTSFCTTLIEKYGAKVDSVTEDHLTPLHLALQDNNNELVEVLLKNFSANPNIATQSAGKSCLHTAVGLESPVLVEMLLEAGANVNYCDATHKTPLDYASKSTKAILKKAGAVSGKKVARG